MENFFARYKNPLVLMAVLFIQVVALATQVKRQETRAGSSGGGTRLIRVWTVTAFTPVEKALVSTGHFFRDGWHNYADLRGVRKQNQELQNEVARLQMEQVRIRQDADQARRLQALLEFKSRFISRTLAAQVIGTSGTEQSRVIIIDKGSRDGIKADMAVVTPDGIVGKVKDVFPLSSQVLLINDHDSGAGVILEHSRVQGILKGTPAGELQITDIMADEKIEAGDHVITSGGDRIYPKGFSVGTIINASSDRENDPFLIIKIKPAADLRRLEEVLVVTRIAEESPSVPAGAVPLRAADILSQRLPSIPKQDANAGKAPGGPTTLAPPAGQPTSVPAAKPSPAPVVKPNLPAANGAAQKPEIVPGPAGSLKQPSAAAGPATEVSVPAKKAGTTDQKPLGTGEAAPANNKVVVPEKKGPGSGQAAGTVAPGAAGTTTPTPAKPKAAPKNPSTPAAGASPTAPGASGQKSAGPPATAPSATPTPTPETPPR